MVALFLVAAVLISVNFYVAGRSLREMRRNLAADSAPMPTPPPRDFSLSPRAARAALAAAAAGTVIVIGAGLLGGLLAAALMALAVLGAFAPAVVAHERSVRREDQILAASGLLSGEPVYVPAEWTSH